MGDGYTKMLSRLENVLPLAEIFSFFLKFNVYTNFEAFFPYSSHLFIANGNNFSSAVKKNFLRRILRLFRR